MAVHYNAPGKMRDANVEQATTMSLLIAKEAVDKDFDSRFHKVASKAQSMVTTPQADDSIQITAIRKIFATGVAVGASVATGGAAVPVGLAVAAAAKVTTAVFNRAVQSSEREKKKRTYFGPGAEPPVVGIREFIKSATNHFNQAVALLSVLDKQTRSSGEDGSFSAILKQYAQFRHELDKAAHYLESLLLLSIGYYIRMGFNHEGGLSQIGLLPNGEQERDKILFLLRAIHTNSEKNRPKVDNKLFLKYGINPAQSFAACPDDPFNPEYKFAEAGSLLPELLKFHQALIKIELPDLTNWQDLAVAKIPEEKAKEIAPAFAGIVNDLDHPEKLNRWKHSFQRTWREQNRKEAGKDVTGEIAGNVAKFIPSPVPGVGAALAFAGNKLWETVGEKKNWFGTEEIRVVWDSEHKKIRSARNIKPINLTPLAEKVQERIFSAANHLKQAEQKLATVQATTQFSLPKLNPDRSETEQETTLFRQLTAHSSENQSADTITAFSDPKTTMSLYYKLTHHLEKAIDYTQLVTLFECSLALGISELYELDKQYFPYVIRRLAIEMVANE